MTELSDYLREEIEEELQLGYLSGAEGNRRLAALRGAADGAARPAGAAGSAAGAEDDLVDDGRILTSWEQIDAAAGRLRGYLARPVTDRPVPGVVVVHENKGLTPYIRDVARRLARAGYVALAPDLLSGVGGTDAFADPADATAALGRIDAADLVGLLKAGVGALGTMTAVADGKIGAIGFCFGGGLVWRLVTKDPRVAAAVPFYGPNPPLEDVGAIVTPVLAIYGELDQRITSGLPAIETAMREHDAAFESVVYPGAQHAFHNDGNPDRYDPEAAGAAWTRALEHLARWLGPGAGN